MHSLTFDQFVDRFPAPVCVLDANRRVHRVNPQLATLLQRDAGAVRATDWERWVHPIDRGKDAVAWAALTENSEAGYAVEQRIRRADGRDFTARLSFSALDVAEHGGQLQLVVVEDISELRRVQHAVGERRKELGALTALTRRLLDSPDPRSPTWLKGVVDLIPPSFQWQAFTEAAVKVGTCVASTEAHGKCDARFIPRLRVPWVDTAGNDCFLEAIYTGPETGAAPFLVEEHTLMHSLADLLRVAVQSADRQEERDRVERALSSSETHLEMALDAVRMGIIDWDLTTNEAVMSASACEMFGLEPRVRRFTMEEVQPCLHHEDREAMRTHFQAERRDGVVGVHEYRVQHLDGSIRWINTRGRFFFGSDGVPVRRLSVIVDVSERKSLEEQYRQAQKMEAMGQLAGGLAHDFNNLLTIIRTVGELAQSELTQDHPAHADLAEIVRAVDRGSALTRQLLTFSRRDVVQRLRVDLGTVLRQMEPILRHVTGPSLGLSIAGEDVPLVVFADPRQLEQVILNLVVNARDALPEGGHIDISTRVCEIDDASVALRPGLRTGVYAVLTVSDNGIGMDAATQARIFEPFFTTKDAARGTGLGLSSVFGIVKQAEGHVGVYSEPGGGATFRVYLPLLRASDVEVWEAAVVEGDLPRGNETVLVVDDEPLLRQVAQRILGELGYTVLAACDGPEAMAIVRTLQAPIDLLLCDIVLPGHDGRAVADALCLTWPNVPTLFMSGYASDVMGGQLSIDPSARFLEKPFTRRMLAQLVRDSIDGVSSRRR